MNRKVAAVIAVAALAVVGGASADPLRYGAADDWPKYHPCGDIWWQTAADVGLTELRMTVQWTGSTTITSQSDIQAAVDCALLGDVRPILAVYPAQADMIGSRPNAQRRFASFVALVGQTFPGVTTFVIGNEPNVNRFWRPQYVNGEDAAGRDYEHTLARSYDALKAVRPDAVVLGPAISSRGNDDPNAVSNPSHSPVWFIKDMGDAYRASGRTRRLFDEFDMHPYPPVQDTDGYAKHFGWPQAGAADLDRIKQALWDAFHGTGQPTPTEQQSGRVSRAAKQALPINLDEVGSQTVVTGHRSAYTDPPESIAAISQAQQARYYLQLMELAACDPAVKSLLFFPVIDETDLRYGFESGILFADLAPKYSYGAVKTKIASAQGRCEQGVKGVAEAWTHTSQVVGARAEFGAPGTAAASGLSVMSGEDASFTAALSQVAGPRGTSAAAASHLLDATGPGAVHGSVRANRERTVGFKGEQVPPGWYVYAIKLTAAVDPRRTTTLVSSPFRLGPAAAAGKHHGASPGQGRKGKHK